MEYSSNNVTSNYSEMATSNSFISRHLQGTRMQDWSVKVIDDDTRERTILCLYFTGGVENEIVS